MGVQSCARIFSSGARLENMLKLGARTGARAGARMAQGLRKDKKELFLYTSYYYDYDYDYGY